MSCVVLLLVRSDCSAYPAYSAPAGKIRTRLLQPLKRPLQLQSVHTISDLSKCRVSALPRACGFVAVFVTYSTVSLVQESQCSLPAVSVISGFASAVESSAY